MRIAYYTPNIPGLTGEGGIGTYVLALATELARRGNTTHLITHGSEDADLVYKGNRVWIRKLGYVRGVDRAFPGLSVAFRLDRFLRALKREYGLDVVEFPNWEGVGFITAWRKTLPCVVRLSTSSLTTGQFDGVSTSRSNRWDVRRERWMGLAATQLVTHSTHHRNAMAREYRVAPSSIEVIPHGIEMNRPWVAAPSDRSTPLIVYLGRMEARKGTVDLLHAIPDVLLRFPSARFVLIGADRPLAPGGMTHQEYFKLTFAAELSQHVEFLGRLSDSEVESWIQRATVFAAPSRYESFGLIFVEAMRWGVPVVGTSAGAIPEVVEDDVSGLLVPPGNPSALASAICRLIDDPALAARVGQAGRERAEALFSVGSYADQMLKLYSRVVLR